MNLCGCFQNFTLHIFTLTSNDSSLCSDNYRHEMRRISGDVPSVGYLPQQRKILKTQLLKLDSNFILQVFQA